MWSFPCSRFRRSPCPWIAIRRPHRGRWRRPTPVRTTRRSTTWVYSSRRCAAWTWSGTRPHWWRRRRLQHDGRIHESVQHRWICTIFGLLKLHTYCRPWPPFRERFCRIDTYPLSLTTITMAILQDIEELRIRDTLRYYLLFPDRLYRRDSQRDCRRQTYSPLAPDPERSCSRAVCAAAEQRTAPVRSTRHLHTWPAARWYTVQRTPWSILQRVEAMSRCSRGSEMNGGPVSMLYACYK